MKKILLVALIACLTILTASCEPKEAPPIPHDFKITGSVQEVMIQPSLDSSLGCPTVTAFAVKTEDNKIHLVALRGERTAEIQPGAKIELVYNDLWLVAKRWTTITDEKGYKSDIQLFYQAVSQYKILTPPPAAPERSDGGQAAPKSANPSMPKEVK